MDDKWTINGRNVSRKSSNFAPDFKMRMKKASLVISAILFLMYFLDKKRVQQKNEELFSNINDGDFDYNETPFPEGTTVTYAGIKIRSIKNNDVYVRLAFTINRQSKDRSAGTYYWMRYIRLDARLFNKNIAFKIGGKVDSINENGYVTTGHEITYDPDYGMSKSSRFTYLFKIDGKVTLTDDEIKKLKAAIDDGKKHDWAQIDILIKWAWEKNGYKDVPWDKMWTKGIAQAIHCYVNKIDYNS